jgi:hypothetical protein
MKTCSQSEEKNVHSITMIRKMVDFSRETLQTRRHLQNNKSQKLELYTSENIL